MQANATKCKQIGSDPVPVPVTDIVNEILKLKYISWIDFRKTKKKPISELAIKRQIKFLQNHSIENACQIIDQSISNNWQGLFELTNLKEPDNSIIISEQNTSELFNSNKMKIDTADLLNLNPEQINALLNTFIQEQKAAGGLGRSLFELRRHFVAWAKKQKENKYFLMKQQPKPGQAIGSQN